MKITALDSLAFSMQSNPGVYAVLLGSGVSRAAGIPTGWEITLELVRRFASIKREDCSVDPSAWYYEKFQEYPNYSKLLECFARTPEERQQLLKAFLEASTEEREQGLKQPTVAHKTIAELVSRGFIRVIVTTNFDRLMETALQERGITPTVISNVDQAIGALPLVHSKCCVFKVHGDYLDTRILNTPDELASYPSHIDRLLDQIFDEFGLIVCGWSAGWDTALRNALTRSTSRRFTTYWAVRGKVLEYAMDLVNHRCAEIIEIEDSDTFFSKISESVISLDDFSRQHPASVDIAVTSLKRFLSEPKYRIQLHDLLAFEMRKLTEVIDTPRSEIQPVDQVTFSKVNHRLTLFESSSETLVAMAAIGGFWVQSSEFSIWTRGLVSLADRPTESGLTEWNELKRYPATLLLYALGIGAVANDKLIFLTELIETFLRQSSTEEQMALKMLPPFVLFKSGILKLYQSEAKSYAPVNQRICDYLRPALTRVILNDAIYERTFDEFEVLVAIAYRRRFTDSYDLNWVPLGRYGYNRHNRNWTLSKIQSSLKADGDESPYITSGLIGSNQYQANQNIEDFGQFMTKVDFTWL